MRIVHSASVDETQEVAASLPLMAGSIVAFFGEMGVGKTTCIKAIAKRLDIDASHVNSPTFQYLNIYHGSFTLYHFDLYRLRGLDDFLSMGFEEMLLQKDGVCCIEWAERIETLLPKKTVRVHISHMKEQKWKEQKWREQERTIALEMFL